MSLFVFSCFLVYLQTKKKIISFFFFVSVNVANVILVAAKSERKSERGCGERIANVGPFKVS